MSFGMKLFIGGACTLLGVAKAIAGTADAFDWFGLVCGLGLLSDVVFGWSKP